MASEEDDIPKLNQLAPSFDPMSIDELHDYIDALKSEIQRAEAAIETKGKAQKAANSVFSS